VGLLAPPSPPTSARWIAIKNPKTFVAIKGTSCTLKVLVTNRSNKAAAQQQSENEGKQYALQLQIAPEQTSVLKSVIFSVLFSAKTV